MDTLTASLSILKNTSILVYILKGTAFTLIISAVAVLVSILLGSVLALVRNYCVTPQTRIFKWLATIYIEVFRNTPLLLWIFICLVFCPCPAIFARKMLGLNSVAAGQFEAGHAQGFSTVQIMIYIILPQAYKNVIPTLLSQVITTIKDSSYLANVATIELMSRVKKVLSAANMYNGTGNINVSDVFVLFGCAALIYFVINFTLSCIVRSIQKRNAKTGRVAADSVIDNVNMEC